MKPCGPQSAVQPDRTDIPPAQAVLIDGPDALTAITSNPEAIPADCWFITPDHVGRQLGLGWAVAVQEVLTSLSAGWHLIADCGNSAGDAAHAISLGLPGTVFYGDDLDENAKADVAERLSSMAEQRGTVFLSQRPAVQPAFHTP